MFSHQGKSRTLKHNLQLATILSLVAGTVNVCGFLAIEQLTTNVTGHFALFINDVADAEFLKGTKYFVYIFSFFFGSFISSTLIESFQQNKKLNVYVIPTVIECVILTIIATFNHNFVFKHPNVIASLLLFSMGLQNSYVTKISNAVVRTTHLTGLFTDLGIELSQLLFPKSHPYREKLKANIKLRIYIIVSFLLGGLIGGFLYLELDFKLKSLLVSVFILLVALFYDELDNRKIKEEK